MPIPLGCGACCPSPPPITTQRASLSASSPRAPPRFAGRTVAERRVTAQNTEQIDVVRRLLCHEPRGHADMYGCFVVPPDDDGADFGVLFWHKDGYSTACGHGTIALGAWAADSGRVWTDPDGTTEITIDVPSGRVVARVVREGGRTVNVTFRNVASYVVARDVAVSTARGEVKVDLSWGGALYASLRAADVGLSVDIAELPGPHRDRTRNQVGPQRLTARAPSHRRPACPVSTARSCSTTSAVPTSAPCSATSPSTPTAPSDRSPCGSGTAARVALLVADGLLGPGETLRHQSIVGTTFTARIAELTTVDGRPAVIPEVDGMAYRTGEHIFILDEHDELGTGFVLR